MAPAKNRSVLDYDSEEALRKALMMMPPPEDKKLPCTQKESVSGAELDRKRSVAGENGEPMNNTENLDWVLPSYDPDTTEAQSMKEELHRLLVLKSYLILDSEREAAFDRVRKLAVVQTEL